MALVPFPPEKGLLLWCCRAGAGIRRSTLGCWSALFSVGAGLCAVQPGLEQGETLVVQTRRDSTGAVLDCRSALLSTAMPSTYRSVEEPFFSLHLSHFLGGTRYVRCTVSHSISVRMVLVVSCIASHCVHHVTEDEALVEARVSWNGLTYLGTAEQVKHCPGFVASAATLPISKASGCRVTVPCSHRHTALHMHAAFFLA